MNWMKSETRNPKSEGQNACGELVRLDFDIHLSFVIRHSSF